MAILNTKFPTNLTEYPNSFKRQGSFPLEAYSVFYDILNEETGAVTTTALQSAQNYASSNPIAYVGQILAVVNDNEGVKSVTAYVIDNADGDLKEVGSSPVGDESTITVADDGTISLFGVNSLTFERDIIGEDGQPTGDKEEVQYQPLMTKSGLIWVEPSKTTVEGLALLIEALDKRVKDIEDQLDNFKTKQTVVNDPTAEGTAVSFIDSIAQNENGEITVTKKSVDLSNYQEKGNYKVEQSEVSDPTADGTALEFIDTISQNKNGEISVTKKTVDLSNYQEKGDYKTKQAIVEDKITEKDHVLTSLTQNANGEIAYEVKKLTPADIGALTAEEVAELIGESVGQIDHFRREIVSSLPEVGEVDVIYMVKREDAEVISEQVIQDVYDEYLYIPGVDEGAGSWELIGNTIVDLSNYYTKEEADTAFISPEELTNELENQSVYIDIRTEYKDYETSSGQGTPILHPNFTDAKTALEKYFKAVKNNELIPKVYFRNGKDLYLASTVHDQNGRRTTYFKAWLPEFNWTETLEDNSTIVHTNESILFVLKIDLTEDGTDFSNDIETITGSYEPFYTDEISENNVKAPTSAAVYNVISEINQNLDNINNVELPNKVNYSDLNTTEFTIVKDEETGEKTVSIASIDSSKVLVPEELDDENLAEFIERTEADINDVYKNGIFKDRLNKNEFLITKTDDADKWVKDVSIKAISAEKITEVINSTDLVIETKEVDGQSVNQLNVVGYKDLQDLVGSPAEGEKEGTGFFKDGERFINKDEIDKLKNLVLDDEGGVGISGTINASNVKELDTAVINIVTREQSTGEDGVIILGLGVERGAQVNKIENISIDGLPLDITTDKTVDIPVATANALGVVRSTDKENFVYVHSSNVLDGETVTTYKGEMEIKSLNVNRLVQTAGERLILNGGNAGLN